MCYFLVTVYGRCVVCHSVGLGRIAPFGSMADPPLGWSQPLSREALIEFDGITSSSGVSAAPGFCPNAAVPPTNDNNPTLYLTRLDSREAPEV